MQRCFLRLAIFLFSIFLIGCAPAVSTRITKQGTPLAPSERFLIYGLDDPLPDQRSSGICRPPPQ